MAVLALIRLVVAALGIDNLEVEPAEVGTHSNRPSTTMLMYLNGARVYIIMLVGAWSSDASLLCIWKQVLFLAKDIWDRILQMG